MAIAEEGNDGDREDGGEDDDGPPSQPLCSSVASLRAQLADREREITRLRAAVEQSQQQRAYLQQSLQHERQRQQLKSNDLDDTKAQYTATCAQAARLWQVTSAVSGRQVEPQNLLRSTLDKKVVRTPSSSSSSSRSAAMAVDRTQQRTKSSIASKRDRYGIEIDSSTTKTDDQIAGSGYQFVVNDSGTYDTTDQLTTDANTKHGEPLESMFSLTSPARKQLDFNRRSPSSAVRMTTTGLLDHPEPGMNDTETGLTLGDEWFFVREDETYPQTDDCENITSIKSREEISLNEKSSIEQNLNFPLKVTAANRVDPSKTVIPCSTYAAAIPHVTTISSISSRKCPTTSASASLSPKFRSSLLHQQQQQLKYHDCTVDTTAPPPPTSTELRSNSLSHCSYPAVSVSPITATSHIHLSDSAMLLTSKSTPKLACQTKPVVANEGRSLSFDGKTNPTTHESVSSATPDLHHKVSCSKLSKVGVSNHVPKDFPWENINDTVKEVMAIGERTRSLLFSSNQPNSSSVIEKLGANEMNEKTATISLIHSINSSANYDGSVCYLNSGMKDVDSNNSSFTKNWSTPNKKINDNNIDSDSSTDFLINDQRTGYDRADPMYSTDTEEYQSEPVTMDANLNQLSLETSSGDQQSHYGLLEENNDTLLHDQFRFNGENELFDLNELLVRCLHDETLNGNPCTSGAELLHDIIEPCDVVPQSVVSHRSPLSSNGGGSGTNLMIPGDPISSNNSVLQQYDIQIHGSNNCSVDSARGSNIAALGDKNNAVFSKCRSHTTKVIRMNHEIEASLSNISGFGDQPISAGRSGSLSNSSNPSSSANPTKNLHDFSEFTMEISDIKYDENAVFL